MSTTCSLLSLAAVVALAACGGAKQPDYAKDGDTGAAAPATQQTLSPTPTMGDSAAGVNRGTGGAVPAGDTTAGHAAAKGAPRP
ncbi:hypothetical protein J421_2003 [Gemmatirosa kalamazoonensis]|uniref:Lipoprotein n=1 Tax=Gemmatirosa kalamazoonensis TaxID=861299 RepID=W0RGS9_9BACT|nr:hypothetical protein [Gemmatirosa kalamazoonensis]AHG89540.1 hypothetical protein J421_2003 [Gemmatirosa kalamazoonensis]